MPATKKYKLYSPAEGGKLPCAFYASPEGCRNGENCKFAHEKMEAVVPIPTESGSVISSESSQDGETNVEKEETEDFPFTITAAVQKEQGEKKKKNRRSKKSENDLPFANPKKKVKHSVETVAGPPKHLEKEKQQSKERDPPQQSVAVADIPEYLSLNLPIASFSMPVNTPKSLEVLESKPETPKTKEDPIESKKELPTPNSTEIGRKWLPAVLQSRKHFRYQRLYDFAKFMQLDEDIGFGGKSA